MKVSTSPFLALSHPPFCHLTLLCIPSVVISVAPDEKTGKPSGGFGVNLRGVCVLSLSCTGLASAYSDTTVTPGALDVRGALNNNDLTPDAILESVVKEGNKQTNKQTNKIKVSVCFSLFILFVCLMSSQ